MAQIVAAFGVTHAAVMLRTWERAPVETQQVIGAGYATARERLRAANPDVVIMVANDHFQSFFLDNMPAFCLGIGKQTVGWGDAELPKYELAVPEELAEELLEGLLDRDFDIAYSRNLPVDHAFITAIHLLMPETDIPFIPLFQNCVAPPLPSLQRCLDLGVALRDALEKMSSSARVALIATGGLSHEIPLPNWRQLSQSSADQSWLDFMSQGRNQADPATQQAIADEVLRWGRSGAGRINEEFDHEILQLLNQGNYRQLASYDSGTIRERGGNGGQELRNWATVAGACAGFKAETLFYRGVPEWLTGVAGADLMATSD